MHQFFADFMNDKATFLCTITIGFMLLGFAGLCLIIHHYNK